MSDASREPVLVIGAGIAGLSVARMLTEDHHVASLVVEASDRIGGRVETVYDGSGGRVKYEAGAWRVPMRHNRTIRLFQKLGVSLRRSSAPQRHAPRSEAIVGLSEWDVRALHRKNPLSADYEDLRTGQSGSTAAQSMGDPDPDASADDGWMVSDDGFSALVERLATGTRILRDTRVVDVRRSGTEYIVQCRCLEGGGFVNRTYTATTVFICVPPHCTERWTVVSQWCRAQLYAVESNSVHTIHARTTAPTSFHAVSPSSLLGQSVSAQHKEAGWFQASLTGGRLARFWRNMRLALPAEFVGLILEEIRRTLHVSAEPDTIASRFHEHAYHAWRPSPGFAEAKAVAACVMPNAKHLPNVFWCGEAFSSHQGWIEGALETAELAVRVFTKKTPYVYPRRALQPDEFVIEGRVIDAYAWANLHPGGAEAIRSVSGSNATDLFYHMRHGPGAWSVIHALQVAVDP